MIVEILGIHHANKGAMLMLEAICAKLRQEFPGVRMAVSADMPFDKRAQYGLLASIPRDRRRFDLSILANLIPRGFRSAWGLAAPRDIGVILDASGFGYGDYWGRRKLARRLLRPLRHWKTRRNAIVLLPQALGPFELPGMKADFAEVLRRADLIFVRDKESSRYVEVVSPGSANVRLAPDFTNLLHPALPEDLRFVAGKSIVIPNLRVISGPAQRGNYIAFLVLALEAIAQTSRESIILVHEGDADAKLAADVNARLRVPVRVIDQPSPLVTKAIIAAGDLVVSSRFHGLVSALSSGVPALACGWSHKYGELMDDYHCRQHVIDIDSSDTWKEGVEKFLVAAGNAQFRHQLAVSAEDQRIRTEAMWREVFALIRTRLVASEKPSARELNGKAKN